MFIYPSIWKCQGAYIVESRHTGVVSESFVFSEFWFFFWIGFIEEKTTSCEKNHEVAKKYKKD